jgi:hypothetical protein
MACLFSRRLARAIAGMGLLYAACAASSAWASGADTPDARRAAATVLVQTMSRVMGPERLLAAMRAGIEAPLAQQVRTDTRLTLAQQNRVIELIGAAMSEVLSEALAQALPQQYAAMTELFVERFTLSEIEAVTQFQSSPVGIKSMTVMQEDLPRLMQPVMQTLQSLQPRILQRLEGARQQLQREGIELRPPPR